MRKSKVLAKLRAGKPVLMTNISMSQPYIVEIAGRCGIDGVWIDMEHRPFTQREVAELLAAARLGDTDAMVRIRKGEGYTSFFRPLEDGAAGIMVPHITTREEAQWVARNAKYPPQGRRGLENVMPDSDMSFSDSVEYMKHANRETFVALQIEDVEALDHLDEIAAVDGIDVIFIGPADLSASMGIPFQFDKPEFEKTIRRIGDAAVRNGKAWGLPVRDVKTAKKRMKQGAAFFNIGGDFSLLKTGFQTVRAEFDRVMK